MGNRQVCLEGVCVCVGGGVAPLGAGGVSEGRGVGSGSGGQKAFCPKNLNGALEGGPNVACQF